MDRTTCPSCGAEIDADHPQGLPPACLLKEGREVRALCGDIDARD